MVDADYAFALFVVTTQIYGCVDFVAGNVEVVDVIVFVDQPLGVLVGKVA